LPNIQNKSDYKLGLASGNVLVGLKEGNDGTACIIVDTNNDHDLDNETIHNIQKDSSVSFMVERNWANGKTEELPYVITCSEYKGRKIYYWKTHYRAEGKIKYENCEVLAALIDIKGDGLFDERDSRAGSNLCLDLDTDGQMRGRKEWMSSSGIIAKFNNSRIRPQIQDIEMTNSIGMKFRLVNAGTFMMGSDEGGPIGQSKPAHQVTLTYDFYMGKYEVTQSQYQEIMGENPSEHKGSNLPIAGVTFEKAEEFCRRLSQIEGVTYRLPYEAEWEYAYRAGATTKYPWGNELEYADDYGWHQGNSYDKPHPVGLKKPNNWGFYDMSGNVQEYTKDIYGLYKSESAVDPKGASSPWGTLDCTLRSGSYELAKELFDCSFRHGVEKDSDNPINTVGFRVVREIK
jgi:formylglycine-generating enzyme required for sulfatase activity